jgi:tetratricopeptide (TPR) repeat protein
MENIKWIDEYIEEANRLACNDEHEQALKILNNILFEEPGYARLHHTIGCIYFYHAEEAKKAEQHFRLAIRFDPEFAETYGDLGQLLSDDERLDEAIHIYSQGMNAKKANKTRLLSSTAKAYELKKKYAKAIKHYKEALGHSAELWNCLTLEESIKRCKRKQR